MHFSRTSNHIERVLKMDVEKKIDTIKKQFDENINSHVFLIETDNIEKATKDLKDIIAHAIGANEITKKQIIDENYIELTTIQPTGSFIIKDDILRLQEEIKTKPILSDKRFYIIIQADLLNDSAANKLLKTIEEPQDKIYGFLITQNVPALLPTIKSRCQLEQFYYNNKMKTENYLKEEVEIADNLIKIIETGTYTEYVIYKTNNNIKEIIKTSGKSVANIIKDYYNISCNIKRKNLSGEIINKINDNNSLKKRIQKSKYINNLLNKNTQNMNAELLLDKIIIDLKEVKEDASGRNKI